MENLGNHLGFQILQNQQTDPSPAEQYYLQHMDDIFDPGLDNLQVRGGGRLPLHLLRVEVKRNFRERSVVVPPDQMEV